MKRFVAIVALMLGNLLLIDVPARGAIGPLGIAIDDGGGGDVAHSPGAIVIGIGLGSPGGVIGFALGASSAHSYTTDTLLWSRAD